MDPFGAISASSNDPFASFGNFGAPTQTQNNQNTNLDPFGMSSSQAQNNNQQGNNGGAINVDWNF